MTAEQWQKEEIRLKGAITRLKNRALKAGLLADKLELKREQKAVEEALRQHRQKYFKLVSN